MRIVIYKLFKGIIKEKVRILLIDIIVFFIENIFSFKFSVVSIILNIIVDIRNNII